jgi:hypothetical protein
MMNKNLSRYALLIGLLLLAIVMTLWLQANTSIPGIAGVVAAGSIIPLLLFYATARKTRNWSGITALCMIPYSVIGIMEIVATLAALDAGMALGVIAIVDFFTALDAGRRSP